MTANVGVQVNVPAVRLAFGVNMALLLAGRLVRFAVSVAIGSPSGSSAVMFTVAT